MLPAVPSRGVAAKHRHKIQSKQCPLGCPSPALLPCAHSSASPGAAGASRAALPTPASSPCTISPLFGHGAPAKSPSTEGFSPLVHLKGDIHLLPAVFLPFLGVLQTDLAEQKAEALLGSGLFWYQLQCCWMPQRDMFKTINKIMAMHWICRNCEVGITCGIPGGVFIPT